MNETSYYYDDIWKEHEINYLSFSGYNFIKDLSYTEDKCKSIILLFNYNGKNILRGYCDGIIFPEINYFNIENIHIRKKNKKIQKIFDYINSIFNKYQIVNTKIYQCPYICKKLGYSIFDLIDLKKFKLKYKLSVYFEKLNNDIPILSVMKGETRTNIKKYINKCEYKIYFGDIDEQIFSNFVDKHLKLAGKKTKSDKCWNLLKQMIIEKKSLLITSDNNFILYFVSKNYCYYAINACDRRDKIVSYLLYMGMEWLNNNGYKTIYFSKLEKFENTEKMINIARFKKGFCNKIFTNYYLTI